MRFLYVIYTQKVAGMQIPYQSDPSLASDFRYDALAKQLSDLCEKLMAQ
ncbi:MAG: hypothetical protein IJB91_02910 [Oscillospiraceae bacterium]|nr:hypothetical protein [Oscillospiraceae bacterium]